MSILDDIREKAESLIKTAEPYATRSTTIYNPSRNSVVVAGFPLDGVVSSTISLDTIMRQETGIDYYYTVMYEEISSQTLTVTLLPTAKCLSVLRLLALRQLQNKGWFNIVVNENDTIVNVYRGTILSLPEISMSQEADNRVITFAVKTMYSGVSVIDQTTITESNTYSKYGINPALGNSDTMIINESTGTMAEEATFDVEIPEDTTPIIDATNP